MEHTFTKFRRGGFCIMGKTTKGKKEKIPRLTEAEYAEYISSLKTSEDCTRPTNSEEKTASLEGQLKKEG